MTAEERARRLEEILSELIDDLGDLPKPAGHNRGTVLWDEVASSTSAAERKLERLNLGIG